MMTHKNQLNSGQSLFELVVALAISALIVVALVSLATNATRNASFSRNNTLASRHAQEATEWLRGQRDDDINTFMTNVQIPVWCMQNLNWDTSAECEDDSYISGTFFVRNAIFNIDTSGGKTFVDVTVSVTWQDSQGFHEVINSTRFTDWRER